MNESNKAKKVKDTVLIVYLANERGDIPNAVEDSATTLRSLALPTDSVFLYRCYKVQMKPFQPFIKVNIRWTKRIKIKTKGTWLCKDNKS